MIKEYCTKENKIRMESGNSEFFKIPNEEKVIKVIKDGRESDIYRYLEDKGVDKYYPKYYGSERINKEEYIIIEYLRDFINLLDYKNFGGGDIVGWVMNSLWDVIRKLHQVGVYHRDLKPSNIMIRFQKESIDIKIIDFGISLTKDCIGSSKDWIRILERYYPCMVCEEYERVLDKIIQRNKWNKKEIIRILERSDKFQVLFVKNFLNDGRFYEKIKKNQAEHDSHSRSSSSFFASKQKF